MFVYIILFTMDIKTFCNSCITNKKQNGQNKITYSKTNKKILSIS